MSKDPPRKYVKGITLKNVDISNAFRDADTDEEPKKVKTFKVACRYNESGWGVCWCRRNIGTMGYALATGEITCFFCARRVLNDEKRELIETAEINVTVPSLTSLPCNTDIGYIHTLWKRNKTFNLILCTLRMIGH